MQENFLYYLYAPVAMKCAVEDKTSCRSNRCSVRLETPTIQRTHSTKHAMVGNFVGVPASSARIQSTVRESNLRFRSGVRRSQGRICIYIVSIEYFNKEIYNAVRPVDFRDTKT